MTGGDQAWRGGGKWTINKDWDRINSCDTEHDMTLYVLPLKAPIFHCHFYE